ncbi:unnamed protein product [Linum trigynum]|uniref:CCHC-type domain-containing protein n=1 Tax=Linum trigynum TaxID=586398 RepID=A0AAV2G442_9ROSI
MLSPEAIVSPSPPTTPGVTGWPPDANLPNPPRAGSPVLTASSQPLNFKAALSWINQETPRKASQWTFVGADDIETGCFQGEPELKLSSKFKERLCQPWKKTLVVRLLGRSIAYPYLCSQLRRMWRPVGSLEILDLSNDTFLTTFGNDQDYLRALTGGPWVILDHYLVVHQWSPTFRTSDKPHRSVVAWVQFPELPVHFYHREVLFAIGNLIGRTVKLDYHTEMLERGKFARIAIDLDMTKPLPTRVRLDGAWQQVIYENIPTICYSCGRIGHTEEECPLKKPTPMMAITVGTGTNLELSPVIESSEIPAGYGPWMQVARKAKRHTRKPADSQPQNQGNNKGKKQDTARDSGSTKGKGSFDGGKVNQDTKVKGEQKQGNKHAKQGKLNEKATTESLTESFEAYGQKKMGLGQEWRPIGLGPKNKGEASTSAGHGPNDLIDKNNSSETSPPLSQSSHVIIGPNNTKIQVLTVPDLKMQQKENRNPNTGEAANRKSGYKQEKEQALHLKGISLKATKRPLQICNSGKKEGPMKHKQTAFPLSIKAIEEFCTTSQKKIDCLNEGETKDVAMIELPVVDMPTKENHTGEKGNPIPAPL